MSRKRLKDMLRKEMDERIKTYDTKPVEKPSLKFDLKTDLLGKTEAPPELKPILKQAEKVIEEPEKKTKEEEPLKRFNKYLEEDESSSESDYSDSEHSEDAEDTYKQYKNKVDKVNFRKVEKSEEYKVKKDIDSRKGAKGSKADEADEESGKEDERKDDRKKDDFRKIENERSRKLLDEPRRRDDEPRRRDDNRDEPRRRDDNRDEPRRRDDRDEPRRRDEIPSREVHKGNQFLELPKKHILQIIKSKDVDSISADCVDEIKDILQDFTTHMFELFSDGDKVVIAERDDIKSYISLFIEDDDKEMVDELTLPSKDIENAINNISDRYNVKIKKDVVYLVHMFLESILVKVITGAKMINDMSKTKRISGKELRTSYKIYML